MTPPAAKSDAGKAAKEAAANAEPPEDEPKFPQDVFVRDAQKLVGQRSHVVAGALYSVEKKELTVTEVSAACDKYLKAKDSTEGNS